MPYLADVAIFGLVIAYLFLCADLFMVKGSFQGHTATCICLAFAFGCGFLGTFIGTASLFSSTNTAVLLVFGLVPVVFVQSFSKGTLFRYFKLLKNDLSSLRGVDRLLFVYVSVVFALTFVLTLAPPNAAEWDSLMYHLAVPAQYLRHGKLVELPYDHHSYFPFTLEMLFMWGLAIKGPVLAKLFHWLMLPLSCGALVAIGQKHLSLRAGLFAAALFASLPVAQAEASTAYIDLGLTAFVLVAYLCFAHWRETKNNWWLLWCGVFCGFCLGTKYLGALTFAWLGLWALGTMVRGRQVQVKPLFAAAGLAILLGGGWYLRNYLWTGNPVYPFAYEIFGGKYWTAAMAEQYKVDQLRFGFGRGWEDLLLAPWRLSMAPFNTGWSQIVVNAEPQARFAGLPWWPIMNLPSSDPQDGVFEVWAMMLQLPARSMIGPPLLAFGLPLLFIRRKPWLVNFILLSAAFYGLFWFATGQYLRYLLPTFALMCLPCGWVIEKFLSRSKFLVYVTGASLIGWFVLTPLVTLYEGRNALNVVMGRVTPEEYLTRSFGPYPAMKRVSSETPEKARLAVYGEPRSFYINRDYIWADAPHSTLIDYSKIKTGADLVKALKAQGATHVYINDPAPLGGPPPQWKDAVENGLVGLLFAQVIGRPATLNSPPPTVSVYTLR